MDITDYKQKYGEPQTLEEILNYCAFLRGVVGLEHRTLHEFNWFVSAMIFGKTEHDHFLRHYPQDPQFELEDNLKIIMYNISKENAENQLKIYNKYNNIYNNNGSPLLAYAHAFKEYCEEVYVD